MSDGRKLIRAKDIILIGAVLAAAAAWYFLTGTFSSGNVRAVITRGGETVAELSLNRDGDYSFAETGDMVFTVREGGISVTESGCPDKICVRTGSISRLGESVVCVPNRMAVTLKGGSEESGVDVVLR
ncbi:MAG: NusG domain II-containing protein [Prevotella sp.]|nr:NusG domain II-containing protein [Prevotella sp.]